MAIATITWTKNSARIIDQRQLPHKLVYINCRDVETLWKAIKTLSVRGAPALGVAAAFGVLLGIKKFKGENVVLFSKHIDSLCKYIGSSRPTAVNLFAALKQMKEVVIRHPKASVRELKDLLKREAFKLYEDDRRICRAMGDFGAELIGSKSWIMTVCNAGALATVDYGTALGVMYSAKKQGKKFQVYACETRPLLQGARLTVWELLQAKIDTTLICDNMAATLMQQKRIDAVFAGADRIAANGDTANKIGTYNLAVLAKYHNVPFYIVAPLSTFDLSMKTGKEIPIEERDRAEVTHFRGVSSAPKNVKVYNPAFDVTDHVLISGIVTELGIIQNPNEKNIKKFLKA